MVSGKQPQKLLLLLQTGGHHIRTLLKAIGTIHCRHRHTDTHVHLHTLLGFCSTEKASYQPAKRDRMLKSVTLPHLRRPCSKISVMCGERQRRTALEAFSSSDGSGTLVCSEYTRGGGKGTKRSPSHPSCHTPHVTPLTSHPSCHTPHVTPLISHPSHPTPHVTPLTSHPSCHTPHNTLYGILLHHPPEINISSHISHSPTLHLTLHSHTTMSPSTNPHLLNPGVLECLNEENHHLNNRNPHLVSSEEVLQRHTREPCVSEYLLTQSDWYSDTVHMHTQPEG